MIKLPIHEVTVHIEVKENAIELQKRLDFLKKKYKLEFDNTCLHEGMAITHEKKCHILFDVTKLNDNLISHEIYHATINILYDNENVNDEEHARLNGYLNQEVRKYIKKKWQIKDI